METIYLWPDRPALSLLFLWGISSVALWAARDAMRELFERLGKSAWEALDAAGRWCKNSASVLQRRSRAALLAAGGLELQGKLEKDFHRIETGFSERLGQYSILHRKLDELVQRLEQDYQESGISPPDVPGWTAAVESIAGIPSADDPNIKEIIGGIQKSLDEAQRQALHAYRADAAERHEILERTRSIWKEVRVLLERTNESVGGALHTAARVNVYIDDYARVRDDDNAAARALSYSATKRFAIALLVLCAAMGGAFANWQLIAPALTRLLPTGAQIGGVSAGGLSALALVGIELALGAFALDGLGLTELFPRLARLPAPRRRTLLGVSLGGLLVLALASAGLAESALLGFAWPWLVAMAALPLEVFLDNGRHVAMHVCAIAMSGLGSLAFVAGRTALTLIEALPSLYDAYVSIPLRIERAIKSAPARRRVVDARIAREEAS